MEKELIVALTGLGGIALVIVGILAGFQAMGVPWWAIAAPAGLIMVIVASKLTEPRP